MTSSGWPDELGPGAALTQAYRHCPPRCLLRRPDWRGVTRAAISLPAAISARRSSQVCCRFIHNCGVVPKYSRPTEAAALLCCLESL